MKLLFAFLLLVQIVVFPCTSAVVSSKASPDGRPLLWKHRDSGHNENKLVFFKGFKYDFIGVINTDDSLSNEVWMGSNSTGFSIMNTASYNIEGCKSCDIPKDEEGKLMKKALAECATLADFEKMLTEDKGKWGISANFGVIDAQGGAAYYETNYNSFVKYDANDVNVAPDGYILRTNFSFSGEKGKGYGYFRFESAEKIFKEYYVQNKSISLDFVRDEADRNMHNSLTNVDVYNLDLPEDTTNQSFIAFRDFIVRNSTVSSMVVQGVRPGDDPSLTTLWTVLGFPLTTLVTPVWVAAGENLPSITIAEVGKTAEINKKGLILKEKCFPVNYDNGADYLNVSAVINKKGTGIVQRLLPNEKTIVTKTKEIIAGWKKDSFKKTDAEKFYIWLDEYINSVYKKEFGI